MNPGTTCHGEIVEYEEFLSVPKQSTPADLLTYVQMLTDYVNVSNATVINVTANFGTTTEWLEQRRIYFGRASNSPPPAPPPTDANPPVERPFFFDEKGVRVDIPQVDRDNAFTEHFTQTTPYAMRYITSNRLADRYMLAGKLRGDPEQMPKAYFHRANCGDEEATLVKVYVRILLQPHAYNEDSRTDFFMRTYGGTLDSAFKRFDVRTCFTETTENQRLECDPAPSPPPPQDWVVPPSPPAYAYEVLTLASATGGSALFFIMGCVCCVVIGGHASRGRHPSRMLGVKNQRVDRMPHVEEIYKRHGEALTGPFRSDLQQPARRLNTGFSFGGMDLGYDAVHQ